MMGGSAGMGGAHWGWTAPVVVVGLGALFVWALVVRKR